MLTELLARIDGVLARVNPTDDKRWGPAASDAEWAALFDVLPDARGGDLEPWFRWHNGQRNGASLLVRDLGVLRRVREQGRLLSITDALEVRRGLLARPDAERFRAAVPLFALPEEIVDDDGTPRFVVYQVSGREAGNLVHTLSLSPNTDVWPVAEPRDASGRAGLVAWASSLLELEPALFGPFDELERAQRWVLAAPVVRTLWHGDGGRFGFGPRGGGTSRDAAFVLRRDWSIQSGDAFRALVKAHFAEDPARPRAAWHWGTIGGAAEFCYQAYYCSIEEAWSVAVAAARKLQASYASWRDYVGDYLRERQGLQAASGGAVGLGGDSDLIRACLDDTRHGWRSIPWATPLPEVLPAPRAPAPRTWKVTDGDELHRALYDADSGDVIALARGHYAGSFSPGSPGMTLAGEDGVVLEAITDEPVLSTYHAVTVENVELRARGTVIVNCSVFLRLEGCRIIGGEDGLQSYSADEQGQHDYEVQLVRCVVEGSADRGVVLEDGFGFLEDTQIIKTGGHALTMRARAEGCYARRCKLLGAGKDAVRAFGADDVSLEDVEIRSAAGIGVLLADAARARMARTTITGSGGRGVLVKSGAGLIADRCTIEGSTGANLDLADVGEVAVMECKILGGEWGGVYLHPGSGAALMQTQILGPRLACVFADGASTGLAPRLVACVIGESREGGGIYVANGAHLQVVRSAIRHTPAIAIEIAASQFEADGLTIERCAGGVIAHGDAELRLARTAVANTEGSAVILQGARGWLDELQVRGGLRGLVVGHGAHAVAARCAFSELRGQGPDADDGERAFAILAGEASTLILLGGSIVGDGDDDAVQVMTGARLVCEGLNVLAGGMCGIRASGAHLHLVGGSVTASQSAGILLDRGATASMLRTELAGNACSAVEVRGEATLLVREAKLASRPGESAIFAHAGGRVIVQGGSFQDARRAIATEDSAIVEELPLETAGLSGLLAELVAAIAGPQLADAREAMERWRTRPGEERG